VFCRNENLALVVKYVSRCVCADSACSIQEHYDGDLPFGFSKYVAFIFVTVSFPVFRGDSAFAFLWDP
jgi:hypothetical protein